MEKNDESSPEHNLSDEWMIRPCVVYDEEYSDCKSIRARFNQYFIFGQFQDCIQWQKDYENCKKWSKTKDIKARSTLIKSETARREERLRAHYNNDIWTKRDGPPSDWNKPLPEWMQQRLEGTYLDLKCRQQKGENVSFLVKDSSSLCTIL